jgi:hypothetical protein
MKIRDIPVIKFIIMRTKSAILNLRRGKIRSCNELALGKTKLIEGIHIEC